MRTFRISVLAAIVLAGAGLDTYQAAFQDKPKYTIEQVMQTAHKPPAKDKPTLLKTVTDGKASKEDKEKLLELYTALGQNKPPKGDPKSWKDKTDALVSAAKSILADEKGAADKLKKATTCVTCHDAHKAED
jgi:hypothetical protein